MKEVLKIEQLNICIPSKEGNKAILKDLSLSVYEGEILAIVGESGCGKSMLCKSIMGLLQPGIKRESGSILLNGRELTHLSEREMNHIRGKEVSMVLQNPSACLDPTKTVGAQLCEVMKNAHKDWNKSKLKEEAIALMEQMDIDHAGERFKQYPYNFSGGMLQRVVIAMAVSTEPRLLLADEPTSALDVTVRGEILKILLKLQQERGLSVLFVSHDMNAVLQVADRIVEMKDGTIVAKEELHE